MEEEWKDIEGYEGLYQVSNFGRVKSLNYHRQKIERLMALSPYPHGYLKVHLFKDGKGKRFFVHRLVAQAFIPNPKNLATVNHKDENPSNNVVTNLEWLSNADNLRYGEHYARLSKILTNNPKKCKQVFCFTKEGEFVAKYPSLHEASRQTKITLSNICMCCQGKRDLAGGFKWKMAI